MNLVSTLLRIKGTDVYTVDLGTPVINALELMAEKKVGAVLVTENEKIAGIFSERDFAQKVARNNKLDLNIPVKDLMTTSVVCIHPEESVDECMALMTNKRIRHLPVMSDGKLVGLISIGDVVKILIEDKDLLITNMEKYILGIGYGE